MKLIPSSRPERRRSFQSNRRSFSSFYRLLDMAVIAMVYFIILVVNQVTANLTSMVLLFVGIISYNFCAEAMNLYRFGRAPSNFVMFKTISLVWCFASLLTATFAFILPTSVPFSTNVTLMFMLAATLPTLVVLRVVCTQIICFYRKKGYNARSAIIIGTTPSGYKLANQFSEEEHLGIHFKGFYDDRKSNRVPNKLQYLVRGNVTQALALANSGDVDYIYIALPIIAEERMLDILNNFANSPAKLYIISNSIIESLVNARSQQIGTIQTIRVLPRSFQSSDMGIKRRQV